MLTLEESEAALKTGRNWPPNHGKFYFVKENCMPSTWKTHWDESKDCYG